jgi:hypothetical protein
VGEWIRDKIIAWIRDESDTTSAYLAEEERLRKEFIASEEKRWARYEARLRLWL